VAELQLGDWLAVVWVRTAISSLSGSDRISSLSIARVVAEDLRGGRFSSPVLTVFLVCDFCIHQQWFKRLHELLTMESGRYKIESTQ
jgi:hypothetical protein